MTYSSNSHSQHSQGTPFAMPEQQCIELRKLPPPMDPQTIERRLDEKKRTIGIDAEALNQQCKGKQQEIQTQNQQNQQFADKFLLHNQQQNHIAQQNTLNYKTVATEVQNHNFSSTMNKTKKDTGIDGESSKSITEMDPALLYPGEGAQKFVVSTGAMRQGFRGYSSDAHAVVHADNLFAVEARAAEANRAKGMLTQERALAEAASAKEKLITLNNKTQKRLVTTEIQISNANAYGTRLLAASSDEPCDPYAEGGAMAGLGHGIR